MIAARVCSDPWPVGGATASTFWLDLCVSLCRGTEPFSTHTQSLMFSVVRSRVLFSPMSHDVPVFARIQHFQGAASVLLSRDAAVPLRLYSGVNWLGLVFP